MTAAERARMRALCEAATDEKSVHALVVAVRTALPSLLDDYEALREAAAAVLDPPKGGMAVYWDRARLRAMLLDLWEEAM